MIYRTPEGMQAIKDYQVTARCVLICFADTLSMYCEIVNYKGFSKWGEDYFGHQIGEANHDVRDALVEFAFGKFDADHWMPDAEYFKEAFTIIGDVPEDRFQQATETLQALTDLDEDYFDESNEMLRVIILLDTVLVKRRELEELLQTLISEEGALLFNNVPAYDLWLSDFNFQELLDNRNRLTNLLDELNALIPTLRSDKTDVTAVESAQACILFEGGA